MCLKRFECAANGLDRITTVRQIAAWRTRCIAVAGAKTQEEKVGVPIIAFYSTFDFS